MIQFYKTSRYLFNHPVVKSAAKAINSLSHSFWQPKTRKVFKIVAKGTLLAASAYLLYSYGPSIQFIGKIFNLHLEGQFRSCIEADALWQKVSEMGSFMIRYFDDQYGLKASWSWQERIVRISPTLDNMNMKIAALLFELGNASQSATIQKIEELGKALSSFEFMRKLLQVEYNSKLLATNIAETCVKSGIWSPDVLENIKIPGVDFSTFENFFHDYLNLERFATHRQSILDWWSRL